MPIDLILNAHWVSTCFRPYSVYITLLVCLIKHSLFWKWKGEKKKKNKRTVTDLHSNWEKHWNGILLKIKISET